MEQKFKTMKKIIIAIAVLLLSAPAFAQQKSGFPQVVEIAQVESESDLVELGVFSYVLDGKKIYFLNVGTLGAGDKVLQIVIDPVTRLFIPLGETRDEVMTNVEILKAQFKKAPGTETEVTGNYAPLLPDGNNETVKVTTRKALFGRRLEFAIERDGVYLATYVSKSDFNILVSNLKMNIPFKNGKI